MVERSRWNYHGVCCKARNRTKNHTLLVARNYFSDAREKDPMIGAREQHTVGRLLQAQNVTFG